MNLILDQCNGGKIMLKMIHYLYLFFGPIHDSNLNLRHQQNDINLKCIRKIFSQALEKENPVLLSNLVFQARGGKPVRR